MIEFWQDLAEAIVRNAAEEYRAALRRSKRRAGRRTMRQIRSLEAFFRSDWFACLTDHMDPEKLIRMLKEEENDERYGLSQAGMAAEPAHRVSYPHAG